MTGQSERKVIIGGMVWTFLSGITTQAISFVISVILARLLMPSEYGVIAMITIFVTFANVFITTGFTSSLIQKKDADQIDFSTMFYCSFAISVILYVIIFFSAPLISEFYKMPKLTLVARVLSVNLILSSYNSIQNAYISRYLLFRKSFYTSSIATLSSGVVGVFMAYTGFGVWALVAQSISSTIFTLIVNSIVVRWHPIFVFSKERAIELMNYGSKILGSSLITTVYKELRQLLIGIYYTPVDLALYNRGINLPNLVTSNIDSAIQSVMFPTMSNHSDDTERVKQMLKRTITTSSYITYFFLTLMAVASKPLIHVLLTDKWIDCVPYMQIFCISLTLDIISRNNIQALKSIGRSEEVLKLDILKKPLFLIVILLALPFGVMAIALTSPLNSIYGIYTNMGPTAKYLNYSRKEQFGDLYPSILLAMVMAVLTWPFTLLPWNSFLIMGLQIIVALVTYIVISKIFKVEGYIYCRNIIFKKIKK